MPSTRRQFLGITGMVAGSLSPPLLTATPAAAEGSSEAAVRRRIQPPRFPDRWFSISDHGATPDDATAGINATIAACHAAGGGHVVVPDGVWQTGVIRLLSGVDLHLVEGATLRFSTDPADYLPVVRTRWQGVEVYTYSPLIRAEDQTDIAVTGSGVLDGAGDNEHWWYLVGSGKYGWHDGLPNQRDDWGRLEQMNDEQVPVESRVFAEGTYLRPSFIQPFRCRNVLISGVTVRNAPMWTVHPLECSNVTVENVTVDNLGPNGDGCNPESCTDVMIRGCAFRTHDDCIAIKSGRDADGRRLAMPSRGIVIEDCTHVSGGAAVAVGSEMSGGVEDVFISRLRMPEDLAAVEAYVQWVLCIKSTSTRGGYVHGISVRDVACRAWTYRPLEITFSYQGGGDQSLFPDVRRVRFERVHVARAERAYQVVGHEDKHVADVMIRNCGFDQVAEETVVQNADDVTVRRVRIGLT